MRLEMWDDIDDSEAGFYNEAPDAGPNPAELKMAAQIVVFVEHELQVDISRLRVRVRENNVFIQGSVDSRELREEIIKLLSERYPQQNFEISIAVHSSL